MIGLAVGIDYSLFVVSRYREERLHGLEKAEAIARAGATATRTVLFSGMTVVLALVGMLLVPSNVFIALGLGAILVVIAAVFASMTLLPAVLSLLGDRVNKLTIPWIGRAQVRFDGSRPGGFWDWVSRGVMKQPVISLLLAGGFLIAAAYPSSTSIPGPLASPAFPEALSPRRGSSFLTRSFW